MIASLINIHQRLRISAKIFILTFLMVECIILILGFTYHRHSSATLMNTQTNFANQMIQKSDEYLQLHFNNIQSFFLSIANDNRFQSNNYEEIEKWLNENLIYFMPNTHNIHLIQNSEVVASTSLYNWSLIENDYFLEQMKQITTPMQIYWIGPYHSPVSQHTITAAIEIPSDTGHPVVLALDLDLSRLYAALNPNRSLTLQGDLLLLDRKNEPIYGSNDYVYHDVFERKSLLITLDPAIFDRGWTQTELKLSSEKELFLTRSRTNLMGWQIVWIINKTELLKPLEASIQITWLLAFLSIFLSMGIAYIISLIISRPIKKITSSMDEVSTGNFDVSIRINRKDELGDLAKHFNHMTADIKSLIANLKITEEKKKAADFTALQAQIRPHFLFNTLNTISVVARHGQLNKVDQLISSLTDQLQYNLDTSPKPVTMREELKAIESYFQLMTTRYQDQFVLEMDIEPSTLEYLIPKFILQPIVENCIFHGLVPKVENGTLFIGTSVEADGWDILIEDNGVGMSTMKYEELIESMNKEQLESNQPFQGIGLRNVHQRLQFMFVSGYHIQISSKENIGTRVLIRMPSPVTLDL